MDLIWCSSLDSLACEGLDKLTAKVPALKEATPELPETAKDITVTDVEYAKEYVASYSLAQIVLKLGDKGLQVATDALKLAGLEDSKHVKPVLSGIKTIRRHVRAVGHAGERAADIASQDYWRSLFSWMPWQRSVASTSYSLCLGSSLCLLTCRTISRLLIPFARKTVGDKQGNDRIASYVSGDDPDFVPGDASAEADSEAEEAIVEVVEEVKVGVEDVTEAIKDVVEEVEEEIEDLVENIVDTIENVVETIEDVVELLIKSEDLLVEGKDDMEEAREDEEVDFQF